MTKARRKPCFLLCAELKGRFMKYQDWIEEWLNHYVIISSKQSTYIHYKEVAYKHIVPQLGEYELSELTPLILQKHITELLKKGNLKTGQGLSANSVNGIISIIQGSLRTAHLFGLSDKYIGDKIKRPRVKEKNIECFTDSEQRKIQSYILNKGDFKLFGVILCLYTGLRIGELLSLEWDDIDSKNQELSVSKSCRYGKDRNNIYKRIVDTPKTPSAVRIIPIPKQLIPLLSEIKKNSHSIYIISNGDKPISTRSYQRTFECLLIKLNIMHRGFHALRHTFATRALECGMDVKTLSEILGHKSPVITLSRYAHSLMKHKREMMNKVGMLL